MRVTDNTRDAILIRPATANDAEAILSAHVTSIRGVCAKDYTPEQIDAWVSSKTADLYRKTLEEGNTILVAVEHDRIVGFIDMDFAKSEVRAFYLRPEAIGKGIGSRLIEQAEGLFRRRGVEELRLTSTLTSVGFYAARGFENLGLTTHRLSNGVEVECVKMRKTLGGTKPSSPKALRVMDLGTMPYREAWALQEQIHERVQAGEAETVLLVEHPPVITLGRRGEREGPRNLLASPEVLAESGVEVVQTDRGGDITFHGPGQLVLYPIIRLNEHKLSVGGYVHMLEEIVIAALVELGVSGRTDRTAVGVWTDDGKICAIGVRIRRGVTLHGIALNVTTDLDRFSLIVPCGIADRPVTSLRKILGERAPGMEVVKATLLKAMQSRLDALE